MRLTVLPGEPIDVDRVNPRDLILAKASLVYSLVWGLSLFPANYERSASSPESGKAAQRPGKFGLQIYGDARP